MCFGGVVSSEDKESIEDGVARTDEEYAKRMEQMDVQFAKHELECAKREAYERTWGYFGKYLVLGFFGMCLGLWIDNADTWWHWLGYFLAFFSAFVFMVGQCGFFYMVYDFLRSRWPWVGDRGELFAFDAVRVVLMIIFYTLFMGGLIFFSELGYPHLNSLPFQ
jgi:hypothetical protein